ncbi:hypothetical protein DUNSADRAFT_11288 [Dunaliella salina]|uniref:AP2/ERF domain-containing protein n=1 Tax=Dunaliella salina TaxID=3046 RepID=A0ABQ7GDU4_DUNSA|nr:hypothetical protein DUNSADRAFT_11288 [Dunaliella salina]|eukprot:KAF5832738.1 hypothetical protein DUNSADRAFT_11288 [Dunaliella salina]
MVCYEISYGTLRRWLGTFDTAIEAAQAYDDAARQIRGPQARCNFALPGEIGYELPDPAGGVPLPGIHTSTSHVKGNHHFGGHGGARKRGSFNHGAHKASMNAQVAGGFGQQKHASLHASSGQQQLQPDQRISTGMPCLPLGMQLGAEEAEEAAGGNDEPLITASSNGLGAADIHGIMSIQEALLLPSCMLNGTSPPAVAHKVPKTCGTSPPSSPAYATSHAPSTQDDSTQAPPSTSSVATEEKARTASAAVHSSESSANSNGTTEGAHNSSALSGLRPGEEGRRCAAASSGAEGNHSAGGATGAGGGVSGCPDNAGEVRVSQHKGAGITGNKRNAPSPCLLPEWPPVGSFGSLGKSAGMEGEGGSLMGASPGLLGGRAMGSSSPFGTSVDMVDVCVQLMHGGTGGDALGNLGSLRNELNDLPFSFTSRGECGIPEGIATVGSPAAPTAEGLAAIASAAAPAAAEGFHAADGRFTAAAEGFSAAEGFAAIASAAAPAAAAKGTEGTAGGSSGGGAALATAAPAHAGASTGVTLSAAATQQPLHQQPQPDTPRLGGGSSRGSVFANVNSSATKPVQLREQLQQQQQGHTKDGGGSDDIDDIMGMSPDQPTTTGSSGFEGYMLQMQQQQQQQQQLLLLAQQQAHLLPTAAPSWTANSTSGGGVMAGMMAAAACGAGAAGVQPAFAAWPGSTWPE